MLALLPFVLVTCSLTPCSHFGPSSRGSYVKPWPICAVQARQDLVLTEIDELLTGANTAGKEGTCGESSGRCGQWPLLLQC